MAGLVGRGVNTRKGNQRFFGMKTADIANFSHKLGAERGTNANIPITTGYSGREAARDCISCLRAANAAEVARSWEIACSTKSFVVSVFGMTPKCPQAEAYISNALFSLKL